jgi:hypothetical protein
MANVSLTAAEVVYASLLEAQNLGWRNDSVGVIAALRSAQSAEAIKGTDPRVGLTENKLIFDANKNVTMKVDFAPALTQGFRTARGQAGSGAAGSNGVGNISAKSSSDIVFDKTVEIEIRETLLTSDIFQTKASMDYVNGTLRGSISTNIDDTKYKPAKELLGQVGLQFMRRANADIFRPMADSMLTTLVAAVGKNAAFAAQATPFCPQIKVFKADGYTPVPGLILAIQNTKRMNKTQGNPIVIGGSKLAQYFALENIVSLADSGFNLADVIRQTNIEWYYDERIDTIFGANKIFVIEPNSAVANFFQSHDERFGLVKVRKQNDLFFGTGTLDIMQYSNDDMLRNAAPGSYSIDYDLRIREGNDANDFPINSIVPSVNFGVWTRPTSYLTTESGNILKDVTGIFAFELVNEA